MHQMPVAEALLILVKNPKQSLHAKSKIFWNRLIKIP